MNHLLLMLRDAGIPQSLEWDTFKTNTGRPGYFKEMPIPGVDTVIWVKVDGTVVRYVFNYQGHLKTISAEAI